MTSTLKESPIGPYLLEIIVAIVGILSWFADGRPSLNFQTNLKKAESCQVITRHMIVMCYVFAFIFIYSLPNFSHAMLNDKMHVVVN